MKHVQHNALTTVSEPGSARARRRRSGVSRTCAGVLSATALLAAGCGSSAKAPSPPIHDAALVSTHTAGATAHKARHIAHPKHHASPVKPHSAKAHRRARAAAVAVASVAVSRRNATGIGTPTNRTSHRVEAQRPAPGTGGNAANDDNPSSRASGADSGRPTTKGVPNPCVLVSSAQAGSFTQTSVTVTEAPLGPTCIYQETGGAKAMVMVDVENASFSHLKPLIKHRSELTILQRAAYCGIYGAPVLYVPLGSTRLLHVAAPCGVAAKFANAALHSLGY